MCTCIPINRTMSISCSENGSGYTPSSIVNAFHGVPHFDIDLAQSSADFDASLGYFEVRTTPITSITGGIVPLSI